MSIDLWGKERDEFASALDRYGVYPLTVWEVENNALEAETKELIGDGGEEREHCFQGPPSPRQLYRTTVSVFSPAVASWALNLYAPPNGVLFDPFAGGGTRAMLAATKGLRYIGCEIREGELRAIEQRCAEAGLGDKVEMRLEDARYCKSLADRSADMCLTCPPYWNLERYNGGDADLSNCPTYEAFLAELEKCIRQTARILRPGAISIWVVGLIRNKKMELLPLHHDTARLHQRNGFFFKEEVVLYRRNNGAAQRVGTFLKGQHFLTRNHEYALVFVRDPGKALAFAQEPEPRAPERAEASLPGIPVEIPQPREEILVDATATEGLRAPSLFPEIIGDLAPERSRSRSYRPAAGGLFAAH